MPEGPWVDVIGVQECKYDSMHPVSVKGIQVLLILKPGDEVFALSDNCAHMACPLHRGRLAGYILTCPCHDWRFDIRTGELIEAPEIKIPSYGVKTENGRILIRI